MVNSCVSHASRTPGFLGRSRTHPSVAPSFLRSQDPERAFTRDEVGIVSRVTFSLTSRMVIGFWMPVMVVDSWWKPAGLFLGAHPIKHGLPWLHWTVFWSCKSVQKFPAVTGNVSRCIHSAGLDGQLHASRFHQNTCSERETICGQ